MEEEGEMYCLNFFLVHLVDCLTILEDDTNACMFTIEVTRDALVVLRRLMSPSAGEGLGGL